MLLKKTNTAKFKFLARIGLSGLVVVATLAVMVVKIFLNMLAQSDSKPSASPEDGVYGYYDNANDIGYNSNKALYLVDDEGNYL